MAGRKSWYRVPYALPGGGYTCVQALNPTDAKGQAARYCGWPVRFGARVGRVTRVDGQPAIAWV